MAFSATSAKAALTEGARYAGFGGMGDDRKNALVAATTSSALGLIPFALTYQSA